MTTQIFSISERERLNRFSEEVSVNDLITYFTITKADLEQISIANRLGIAFQLCCLRFFGFYPNPLSVTRLNLSLVKSK